MNILNADGIIKKYGKKIILDNITFQADSGECIAIVGTNGCGKTTFLNILAGTLTPTSGSILINGQKISPFSKTFRNQIGFVPQDNPIFESLTVKDNLKFWYSDTKRNLKEDLQSGLAAMFGLTQYANYTVSKLSGGMKRRLAICCALASNPPILILDEPTAALDLVCKNEIKEYLLSYKKNGGTIIFTSHEDSELSIADTMYLLKNKTLTKLDTPIYGTELLERLNNV